MGVLDRAFAAVYDPVLANAERAGLGAKRRELLSPLRGHVVEIGAGTGANLPHLGAGLERLTLLEPTPEMAARLRARAAMVGPAAANGTRVEVLEAPAEALPVGDGEADAVISTLVLCSVDDLDRSLAEIRRVLRPGGRLVLLEHVAANGRAHRVQRLLEPAWRVAARGCHLTRDTGAALAGAGFDTSDIKPWRLPAGGPTGAAIAGSARVDAGSASG